MSRTTEAQVRSAFSSFCHAAQEVGFDTEQWVLYMGNSSYGYQSRVIDNKSGKSVGRDLGCSKAETWESLRHYTEAWYMITERLPKK